MDGPGQENVTLGEVARSLASLERRIDERFNAMGRRLDAMQFVGKEAYEIQVKGLTDRIVVLEDAKRWTARTLVASFLYPVLVAAVVALVVLK